MFKEVESVVFIPHTPRSVLKNLLQKQDDTFCSSLKIPGVHFVERGGDRISQTIGQSNPWKAEQFCNRNGCLPCQGRLELGAEAEARSQALIAGDDPGPKPPEGSTRSLPGCYNEGVNYTIDCIS